MSMPAGTQEVGHFLKGEPESLRGLDDAQHGHRLRRVEPVPAEATYGRGEQPSALVVAQRLPVHSGRGGYLAGA
jgi:hypothetical protein